ncbi:MAG: DMT family transporter [Actinomycetia bacterium]|nr:DMT family transporter [Actinomycetes bacterium]
MASDARQRPIRSSLILLLTAFIWGMAFVAQRSGMDYIGPFLFAGLRFVIGALTLVAVLVVSGFISRIGKMPVSWAIPARRLILGGMFCGFILFAAGTLQQVGMVYTPASKAGFLTALYIVLVPLLGVFMRQRLRWNAWVSVLIAGVGLYFLSITDGFDIQEGDLIVILGALFWAGHILAVDHFVAGINAREILKLCVVQFLTAGVLALVCVPLFDGFFVEQVFDPAALANVAVMVLYAGVLSTGVAFTLQGIGQQGLRPAPAAIIMSTEAVFSALGGLVLLGELLTLREVVGCILMFAAILLAQLPGGQVISDPQARTGGQYRGDDG